MGKIILCGHGSGGKDYMRKILVKQGFKYGISYTSRSPRPGEVDGIDYYFIPKDEFERKIQEGFWLEYDEFGGQYYGTAKWQFEQYDVFIMTRNGIKQLAPEYRSRVVVMFFDIEEDIRRARLYQRGWDSKKIEERIELDKKEFEGFSKPEYDVRVSNPDF